MPVRSTLVVVWTCAACGLEAPVAVQSDREHPPMWPVLPDGWQRSDAYKPVRFTCSDACRLWRVTGGAAEFDIAQGTIPF